MFCRHPDINANAYTAFGVLAFVIFLGVLGVVNGSVYFWIFFTGVTLLIPQLNPCGKPHKCNAVLRRWRF
jgi:hypothetical protein